MKFDQANNYCEQLRNVDLPVYINMSNMTVPALEKEHAGPKLSWHVF